MISPKLPWCESSTSSWSASFQNHLPAVLDRTKGRLQTTETEPGMIIQLLIYKHLFWYIVHLIVCMCFSVYTMCSVSINCLQWLLVEIKLPFISIIHLHMRIILTYLTMAPFTIISKTVYIISAITTNTRST